MKKILVISSLVILPLIFSAFWVVSSQATNHLTGKIIALDAGHGGTSLGATYPANMGTDADVYEKDVNIATIFALKAMLEEAGAEVVLTRECDERIPKRKDRVGIAKNKCSEVDVDGDGKADGKECDALVSVHHNGNVDETHDGMMVIYNNKEDLVLATYLHNRLIGGEFDGLFKGDTTYDEGYDRGGYGMTVYFTPASLTEGYYVTNKCEAELFLYGAVLSNDGCPDNIYGMVNENPNTDSLTCINPDATTYKIDKYGTDRVNQEAEALYQGLIDYFSSSSGDDGNGGNKCPPGNPTHPKC